MVGKVDYYKGLIYKLCCNDTAIKDIYIGSTTNFKSRKMTHKSAYKTKPQYGVYTFVRENGGWDNWSMIEIEKFACNDKRELETRERYWLEHLGATLNKVIPTRSKKEYDRDNADKIKKYLVRNADKRKERCKEYYLKNANKIKERVKEYIAKNSDKVNAKHREYYAKNVDRIKEQNKEYQTQNADVIRERKKEYRRRNADVIRERKKEYRILNANKIKQNRAQKIVCECGSELRKNAIARHKRTKKHIAYQQIYDFVHA